MQASSAESTAHLQIRRHPQQSIHKSFKTNHHNPDILIPTLTFLGTSTSVGIPVIGCDCETCTSSDPKNTRMRASIHLQTPTHSILVDAGPDLRHQALRQNLRKVDAVLYTHHHLDHITGFDELRAFCWRRDTPLPMYGTQECIKELMRMFSWAFTPENTYKGYVKPDPRPISAPFKLGDLTVTPLPVDHGSVETIGYHFAFPDNPTLAYIPDVKTIPDETLAILENVDHLVIDALRNYEHPTHMSIDEAVAASQKVGAKKTWLTHISHETDYRMEQEKLPSNITFAYDTLVIS